MEILESEDLASAVAAKATERLAGSAGRRASLALASGRTASLYFPALFAAPLDWSGVAITLVDDRLVPHDHPDSNHGMIDRARHGTPAAAASFVPLVARFDDAAAAAAEADERLPRMLPWPLDLAILSLADDGHFASIFPGRPEALSSGRCCIGVTEPPAPHRWSRVSLTVSALSAAKAVIVPLAGAAKRRALSDAMAVPDCPMASLADLTGGRLCVIIAP